MNNNFLENQYLLIHDILDGNATWKDLNDFREQNGFSSLCVDSLRRNAKMLIEYMDEGWIKPPVEEKVSQNFRTTIEKDADGAITSDTIIEGDAESLRDSNFLLRKHGFSPSEFELTKARSSMWQSGEKDLVSSRITVKPISNINIEYVKECFEDMAKNSPVEKESLIVPETTGQLLEISIADIHFGKLAWGEEINGENYDHAIALKRFKYIITDILNQVLHLKFEKIVFLWSNDFFHFDTISNTTTMGTPQDVSLRWQKLFRLGVEALVWAIDQMSKIAPVETFYVGANHDRMTSFYATNYLYAWFRNNENVSVDCKGNSRHFLEFGKCMLGYSHGSEEGKMINSVMAKEEPEMFGRTIFRYMHCGHFHKTIYQNEENGCIVSYLGSPAGTDNWHYQKGFIGSIKTGYGFVYDREKGQRLEIRSNLT